MSCSLVTSPCVMVVRVDGVEACVRCDRVAEPWERRSRFRASSLGRVRTAMALCRLREAGLL